jgi:site-specific recombinase XerD
MPLTSTNVGDLTAYRRSFERSLRAANKSQRTVETYLDALDQLCAFLADRGMPTAAESVAREHIESYLVELLDLGRAPATVSNRFRALQQFFKFLVGEGEIASSPMERMTRPRVPDQPVQVLSEDELRTLLATCSGRSFEDVRDGAIIRLFVDTGMRRAELLGLRVEDLDLYQDVAVVNGKGRTLSRVPVRPQGRTRARPRQRHGVDDRREDQDQEPHRHPRRHGPGRGPGPGRGGG